MSIRLVTISNKLLSSILYIIFIFIFIENIIHEFYNLVTWYDVSKLMYKKIDECNLLTSKKWSSFISILPKVLPIVTKKMRCTYVEKIRFYWKKQILVNTLGISRGHRPHPFEELTGDILAEKIRLENKNLASGPPVTTLLARGMTVFDKNIHSNSLKLPTIVLQEYLLKDSGNRSSVANQPVRGGKLHGCYDDVYSISPADNINMASYDISLSNDLSPIIDSDINKIEVVNEISKPIKDRGFHLIILQHGFQGNSYDMKLLSNYLSIELSYDNVVQFTSKNSLLSTLCARSNEEHSDESIEVMGEKLAEEIVQFCKENYPFLLNNSGNKNNRKSMLLGDVGRISFIGHSLGSLIIRKSLEKEIMKPLLSNLHCFISLASPHLGTIYADSPLVSTGMWALLKYKKCHVLKELVLEDAADGTLKNSMIYKLSSNGVLKHFKHTIFISSPKDQYVPLYSARVQSNSKIENDIVKGSHILEMANNILAQINPQSLVRITIDNNCGDSVNVNTIIGRTAHLSYLENSIVVQQLVYTLYPYLI